jgi:hypothetical protein
MSFGLMTCGQYSKWAGGSNVAVVLATTGEHFLSKTEEPRETGREFGSNFLSISRGSVGLPLVLMNVRGIRGGLGWRHGVGGQIGIDVFRHHQGSEHQLSMAGERADVFVFAFFPGGV